MNKHAEQLQQIEKRIAELQRKAEYVRSLIPAETAEPVVVKTRRGRRKVNETV